ncbi:D-alanine--D-alanine ligase, partial [Patescibacteria group bacterium]|nr:D-alanine--D-alanine ligase [Patescibacteria group bacterium]
HPILIGIDKTGNWLLSGSYLRIGKSAESVSLIPQPKSELLNLSNPSNCPRIDVVFPVLHGPFGEDGTVQGLLKLANLPFVGAGVLGSAVGMDKDVAKRLLKEAGIPIAKFLVFKDTDEINFEKVVKKLGRPFFVKPANLGSSVGVNKVKDGKNFKKAVSEAFLYDRKILIEEYIKGREIECSVLGNDNPIASVPGEVVVKDEFYSYKAKYIDENGAALEIPAKIDEKTEKKIQNLAIQTFKTLCCEGMGRVDFFLKDNGEVLVNEINTIPGFTSISMYPKLWEKSGLSYTRLIDKLIKLALERFKKEQKLKSSY